MHSISKHFISVGAFCGALLCSVAINGAAPANDDFESAYPLEGKLATFTGSFLLSTVQPDEVRLGLDGSLWWKWTPAESGQAVIWRSSLDTSFSHLYVFDAADLSDTQAATNIVTDILAYTRRTYTSFSAEAGKSYTIGIFGSSIDQSQFAFELLQPGERPVILNQPKDSSVSVGRDAWLSVGVFFPASVKGQIQWQFEGTDLPGEHFP